MAEDARKGMGHDRRLAVTSSMNDVHKPGETTLHAGVHHLKAGQRAPICARRTDEDDDVLPNVEHPYAIPHTIDVQIGWVSDNREEIVDLDVSAAMFDKKGGFIECVHFLRLQSMDGSIEHQGDDAGVVAPTKQTTYDAGSKAAKDAAAKKDGAGSFELIPDSSEVIRVHLNQIGPRVRAIFFVVNSFSNTLADVPAVQLVLAQRLGEVTIVQPGGRLTRAHESGADVMLKEKIKAGTYATQDLLHFIQGLDEGARRQHRGLVMAKVFREKHNNDQWFVHAIGKLAEGHTAELLLPDMQRQLRDLFPYLEIDGEETIGSIADIMTMLDTEAVLGIKKDFLKAGDDGLELNEFVECLLRRMPDPHVDAGHDKGRRDATSHQARRDSAEHFSRLDAAAFHICHGLDFHSRVLALHFRDRTSTSRRGARPTAARARRCLRAAAAAPAAPRSWAAGSRKRTPCAWRTCCGGCSIRSTSTATGPWSGTSSRAT